MSHPASPPMPSGAVFGQPSPVETGDSPGGTDHGAGREPRQGLAPDGLADATEEAPDARSPASPRPMMDDRMLDPADVMRRVSMELAGVHALSLDLQEVLSRALDQGHARADLMQDAQGFDRLSQILDNLSRLLAMMAARHPEAPTAARVGDCLTLHDLRARLAGPADPSSPGLETGRATPGRPNRTEGRRPAGDRERPAADSGDISWL